MTPLADKPEQFSLGGMFGEVFFALQEVLNFTFSLKKPPDGQYGSKKPDGSWTGMINLLQTDQADIGELTNK